jgi:hypothetical protein
MQPHHHGKRLGANRPRRKHVEIEAVLGRRMGLRFEWGFVSGGERGEEVVYATC